jgi:hypothetical protein
MSKRFLLFALSAFALPFAAQAQNVLLPVQGLLTDSDGVGIDGSKTLQFELVSGDGAEVWNSWVTAELTGGLFTIYLGQETELAADIFAANTSLSLKMSIDGSTLGAWPLGVAPYAAAAAFAATAGDATTVGGSSADSFASSDNTYVIGPVDACSEGEVLKYGDDGWGCASDNQLSEEQVDALVTNNNFVVGPAQPCADGELLKYTQAGWGCAADANDNNTYTAGNAISLSNEGQFYISVGAIGQSEIGADAVRASELADNSVDLAAMRDNSVDQSKIVDNSINNAEMGDNAIGRAEMQNNAIGTNELDDGAVTRGKLGASGCTNGQILKYGGNGWACSADTDTNTTYSAGSGLARSGTTFSIASSGVTATHLAANSVGASEMLDNAIGLAEMQNESVGQAELRSNSVAFSEMANDAIGVSEMRDNAIGNAEMRDNAIGRNEMLDDAIGSAELAGGAVTNVAVSNSAAIAGHKIAYHNEVYVPGTGTATENGTALRTALYAINATLVDPKVLRIGPGTFDFGTNYIPLDAGLTVVGAGMRATRIVSGRAGSYVFSCKTGGSLNHLSVMNDSIDSVNSSKVLYNPVGSNGRVHDGDAFRLHRVHLSLSGNQNANNMAIDNRGEIQIDQSVIKNITGGTGHSMGIFSSGGYVRISDSLFEVDNIGNSTGQKFNVWASSGAVVEVHSSRIVQTDGNSGDGRALYATGSDSWIYSYSSLVYGKTHSAYESGGGNVTLMGGRMSNNETTGVTCSAIRHWDDNRALNGDCDL